MTIPPDSGPNRPASFDFGLSAPTIDAEQPLTRRGARLAAKVDTRSAALPLIITLAVIAAVGGAGASAWYLVTSAEQQVAADSAPFCAEIASTPGVLSEPGFGWPTDGADLTTTLELMKEYQARWEGIAAIAHPTIAGDVELVAKAAASITQGIEVSKTIDRPATLAQMESVTSKTAIRAWADKYCG